MTKTNVPILRFRGYTGNLEIKKVGDIFNVEDGDWIEKEFIHHEGKYRIIQTGNIGKSVFLPKDDNKKYLDDDGFKELKANLINPGDLLYCRLADPVGRAIVLPNIVEKCVTSVDVAILRNNKETNSLYYQALFNSSKYLRMSDSLASGTTRKRISRKNLEKMNVIVPQIKEQEKIGLFFAKIDNLIELQTKKLEQLKKLKRGYLQKMFPQDGESVPRLRFSGFSGEWKEKRLDSVSNIIGGGTPSTSNSEYWNGNINWFSPVEIGDSKYVSYSLKKITSLGLKKSSAKILPKGSLLFTSRAGIGKTAILLEDASTNQGFQSIVPKKDKLEIEFLYSLSDKLSRYGNKMGSGSTFVEVSGKTMSKMKIRVPNFKEQQQIGGFFSELDLLINNQSKKINVLKQQKKAYLQKMFI